MNRRTELIWLLLILLLAAVMRMGWPGITEFKRDEALLSQAALDMARGRSFPLHGIRSSVGLPNPPVSVYLFAIPYAISSNPVMATWFVGLLNVLAVALGWRLARRYFGRWAALTAALLYAASPWAVLYSRKIWAQDLLPPFAVALVYTGLRGFVDDDGARQRRQAVHIVLLALAVQIHMAAVSLAPLTLVLLVIGRRRIHRRFWLGAALAALTFAPFGIAALQGGWLDLNRISHFTGGAGRVPGLSTEALGYAHLLISGAQIHALAGEKAFRAYLDGVPGVWGVLEMIGAFGLVLALWLLARGWRRRDYPRLVIGLWVWLPIAVFSVTWTPAYPHYLIAMLPGAFIALAAGAQDFVDRRPAARRVTLGAAVVIAAVQVYLTLALLAFVDTHDVREAFGAPLGDLLAVREAAMAGAGEILVYSAGEDPETDEQPAVWRVLLYDYPAGVRFVNSEHTTVNPAAPAVWLMVFDAPTSYPPEQLIFPHGAYGIIQTKPPVGPVGAPIDSRLANGVTLRAYRGARRFVLTWEPSGPADRQYSFFVHLLDAGGSRIAQSDVPAWRGPWQAGDLVETRLDLGEDINIPPDGAWRIGMYYFLEDGSTRGVDVLDEAGNLAGQWIDIPATP
ncbi:MAG: glycosyltransferase family 39 protein [Anaerolineae bacterium]|nr:glycosyltransferase family 39 protein [Anaerolineae bacterium]